MLVFGAGPEAVRAFRRPGGCEVRFGSTVMLGNNDLASILQYVHDDPACERLESFALAHDCSPAVALPAVVDALLGIQSAGAVPGQWSAWWSHVVHEASEVAKSEQGAT